MPTLGSERSDDICRHFYRKHLEESYHHVKPRLSFRSHRTYPISAASLSRPVLRQKKAFILEMLYGSHSLLASS
ncbi:hypothetical protein D0862_04241 [Hortaea werneckii]|uniref:Uncharacterized protein n=1 Tax=Hortaea werneckii TaxID=91943 RepID=A0A3M7H3A1_HORWE|nr:hypothetical protein D0862_04241 [Hortaea werneckii]